MIQGHNNLKTMTMVFIWYVFVWEYVKAIFSVKDFVIALYDVSLMKFSRI